MLEFLSLPYVQEGLVEILLLSIPAGLIGTWVVLRGLAFYAHAIGTASFPGLVLADGLGFSPAVGAFGAAGIFTMLSALISRSHRTAADSVTALALVTCLAVGVILASDVFGSGANVDTLLFGSLLAIGPADLALAAAAAVLAIVATRLCANHWLAKGFDDESAAGLRSQSRVFDTVLLAVVALTVVAALSAVGALLVSALMVIPAATARMVTRRVGSLQAAAVLLVAAEGTLGLWLSVETNAPPGATIAVVSGLVYALALLVRSAIGSRRIRNGRKLGLAAATVATALLITGCGGGGDSDGETVQTVATTTQVADIVREVGGKSVEVTQILQPNTDPHDYEPRPSDVEAVADADLVFRSGGDLDEWTDQLVADSGGDATVVDLSSDLPVRIGGDHDDHSEAEAGESDPHWWHDPTNVSAATDVVEAALVAADPRDEADIEKDADRFRSQVNEVDAAIAKCLESVPKDQRKLVTDHDALGYFANRYDVQVVGAVIPALTSQAEPSAGDLVDLERTIREESVKAVFPESSASGKLADAVAADTGATTEYSLYGDTLGAADSDAATWVGMMQENANNMVLGFTGGEKGCDFD